MAESGNDLLKNIKTAKECPIGWDDMKGSATVRQCTDCGLNTYDLSDLSHTAAAELISKNDKNPSKAIYRRSDGKYMIRDCPSSKWRSWCGPSQIEVWHRLSNEIGATFIEGDFWNTSKVQVSHENWTITLDTFVVSTGKSSVTYTRLRAPFVNNGGFSFDIYRKSFFDDIGKRFGMQDLEIGDTAFDDQFIIKANDAHKVKLLLAPTLRQLIMEYKESFGIKILDNEGWLGVPFPDGVDELYFSTVGIISDRKRLKLLVDIFTETLSQLQAIGTAANREPGVKL